MPRTPPEAAPPRPGPRTRSGAGRPHGKHSSAWRSGSSLLEAAGPRQDLTLAKAEEAFLIGADLVDVHVLEAGTGVLLKAGQVPLRIRPDRDRRRDVFGPHGPGRRLEVR